MTANFFSCYCAGNNDFCHDCFGTGYRTGVAAESPAIHMAKLLRAVLETLENFGSDSAERFDATETELQIRFKQATGHYQEVIESNHNLREEVRSFARMLGNRVLNDRWDGNPKKSLLANPESRARRGIELMVNAEMRSALGDEVLSPTEVRNYLHRILDQQMEGVIKKHLGISDWGNRLENGLLQKTLNERLDPHIKAAVEKTLPAAIESLDLECALDDWQKEGLRDVFSRALRDAVRAKAVTRAEEIATAVVREEVDAIIFDEFPFLKRYLAKERLSSSSPEEG